MNSLPTQVPRPTRRRAKNAAARAVKIEETHASNARQAGVEINLSNATEAEIALARRLGEVRTRLASTQSELTELRTKLADAEASGADARALIAAETDTATLEDLEARIAEYKKQEAAHEEIEDKLRAQINELERQFADLSDTFRQSQNIEAKLRAELEELKTRTAGHEHTPSEGYIAVGDHEAEMNTLRERAQELSDELERLRAEATERGDADSSDMQPDAAEPLALLQADNERLAREVLELKATIETRGLGSVFIENQTPVGDGTNELFKLREDLVKVTAAKEALEARLANASTPEGHVLLDAQHFDKSVKALADAIGVQLLEIAKASSVTEMRECLATAADIIEERFRELEDVATASLRS